MRKPYVQGVGRHDKQGKDNGGLPDECASVPVIGIRDLAWSTNSFCCSTNTSSWKTKVFRSRLAKLLPLTRRTTNYSGRNRQTTRSWLRLSPSLAWYREFIARRSMAPDIAHPGRRCHRSRDTRRSRPLAASTVVKDFRGWEWGWPIAVFLGVWEQACFPPIFQPIAHREYQSLSVM
jgi:hypothetical protein